MTPISSVAAAGTITLLGVAAGAVLAGRYAKRRVSLILATEPPAEQTPTVPGLAYVPAAIRLCRRCDAYTPHNDDRQCHTCNRTAP